MTYLREILECMQKRVDSNLYNIEIYSAEALDRSDEKAIRDIFGDEIIINHTIDRRLVNGIKIKLNDLYFDGSLENQMKILEKNILQFNPEDSDIKPQLDKLITDYSNSIGISEIGKVISINDGICKLSGLSNVMNAEMIEFENGVKGMIFELEKDSVSAVIFGEYTSIKQGDIVNRTKKVMSIGVSEKLLGRVINPLSKTIDGDVDLEFTHFQPIERIAPDVMSRSPVDRPLQTGIKAIDALIPIGKGQRELILGDRQTGKTSIAMDTIINQKGKDVICVYVSIGQKDSKLSSLVAKLNEKDAMSYTVVVNASASSSSVYQYLAPYTGIAISEYFLDKGKDVLIIYDDLTKHAIAYREMSLLLGRPPGREAYPGDVFYIHSKLLERACNLNKENGGGSITALPIIETQGGDISGYIPTNVISITDGQVFLESDLFYKGIRPAINVGLSVSRVGGAAQTRPMKKVAAQVKLSLAQFRELESFTQFASELDENTKNQIERGKRIVQTLKQKQFSPLSVAQQVISIFAVTNGLLDEYELTELEDLERDIFHYFERNNSEFIEKIESNQWDDEMISDFKATFAEFKSTITHKDVDQ